MFKIPMSTARKIGGPTCCTSIILFIRHECVLVGLGFSLLMSSCFCLRLSPPISFRYLCGFWQFFPLVICLWCQRYERVAMSLAIFTLVSQSFVAAIITWRFRLPSTILPETSKCKLPQSLFHQHQHSFFSFSIPSFCKRHALEWSLPIQRGLFMVVGSMHQWNNSVTDFCKQGINASVQFCSLLWLDIHQATLLVGPVHCWYIYWFSSIKAPRYFGKNSHDQINHVRLVTCYYIICIVDLRTVGPIFGSLQNTSYCPCSIQRAQSDNMGNGCRLDCDHVCFEESRPSAFHTRMGWVGRAC